MSDENQVPDELETLKERADKIGVSYHPSIGVDKLREKVNSTLQAKEPANDPDDGPVPAPKNETTSSARARKKREASELVRIQLTCMNPNKAEWEGEMFTAGNSVVGTFRRMVPFNVEWHVERIILNMIKQRQCQVFVSKKDAKGRQIREGKLITEYNVTELPPLTEAELKELAQRQAMASGTKAA